MEISSVFENLACLGDKKPENFADKIGQSRIYVVREIGRAHV